MKTLLLNYLLEASICLAVFYAFYYLVLRRERFFAYNRIFILFAVLFSLLIPVMEIPLSRQAIYLSQQPDIDRYIAFIPFKENLATPVIIQTTEVSTLSFRDFVFYGYSMVVLFLLGRLFFQIMYLYRMAGKSGKKKVGYTLIPTMGKLPTFSFFHWIFWNNTQALSATEENLILQHELVHIRQKHSWETMLLELLKIIFWLNPAIYLLKQAMQEVHEYLADQQVLQNTASSAYIQLLVKQQLHLFNFSFTHSFNRSQLNKRIAMIQSVRNSAKPAVWKLAFALPILATLLFMYSCKTSEITEPKPTALANAKGVYRLGEVVVVGYYSNKPDIKEIQLDETITGYGTSEKKPVIEVYNQAEIMPEPVNGMSSFQHYIRQNIQHLLRANKTVQGRVWVQFTVNTDGSLSDISVVKSPDASYNEEIIAVIKNAPAWKSGKQNGESVAVRKTVPISFGTSNAETSLTQATLISETHTESQPAPIEGLEAFYKKIGKTVRYPGAPRRDFIEGQVWVQFTVNIDGSLSQIEIAESLHPELDQEVVRVVSEAGLSWKPAMLNGQAQASKVLFPVSFKLGA
ncbi:M56 family metallopeptidase [Rhodocytophaga rosea]|uniref:M56 family metallopeptidase n=1 Tax=Rhodocytophaga rosea TaxID=2704465 RepID=A0A6C0GJ33_9BACT|nr:M56 family metallopeptidase [Rhodocytophaga rosea]QHT67693.1 M56 family metallopeptidase [Rhodocytophaga rosea]